MAINIVMKIKCYTLFDITRTNVSNRRRWLDESADPKLKLQRNQQTNFETILQIINMRSQPEDITDPLCEKINLQRDTKWGTTYQCKEPVPQWSFSFTVSHSAVFRTETHELGNLIGDCDGVPMITELTEWSGLEKTLQTNTETRNIYFEVLQ